MWTEGGCAGRALTSRLALIQQLSLSILGNYCSSIKCQWGTYFTHQAFTKCSLHTKSLPQKSRRGTLLSPSQTARSTDKPVQSHEWQGYVSKLV